MNGRSSKLWVLASVLAAGFLITFLLPKAPPMRLSRLEQALPENVDGWVGRLEIPDEREQSILSDDTKFVRRSYEKEWDGGLPGIQASLVFSGKDMNNSIHRPENCLRAQGWTFVRERYVPLPKVLPGEPGFSVRELVCKRVRRELLKDKDGKVAKDKDGRQKFGEPVKLPNGRYFEDWQVSYYFFIGANGITPGHYGRALTDIRDRIVGGYDQQWAYVTFSTMVSGKYVEQGVPIGDLEPLDLDGTGALLADFMGKLLPPLIRPKGEIREVKD